MLAKHPIPADPTEVDCPACKGECANKDGTECGTCAGFGFLRLCEDCGSDRPHRENERCECKRPRFTERGPDELYDEARANEDEAQS